uniref:Integral membrane protein 2C n=1 Tax=Cairina moschata TaxID=8855 RepID=A0A8C3B7M2_CAIMO
MRAGAPCPCTSASSPGFLRVLLAGGVVSPLLCGGIPCPRLLCWAAPPALGSHQQDSSGAGAGSPRRSAPHRASHEALGRSSQPGGAEGGKERTGGGGRGGLGAGLRAVPAPPRGGAHSSGGGGGGAMVKIGVQQPPAALKPEQEKEKAAGGDGAPGAVLLPPGTEEQAPAVQSRRSSLSGVCYLTMGLLVLLLGLVFASMYVYRYFFITQLPRESVFHCGVLYEDSLYSPFKGQLELHEDVKIYIEENYEQINVPVPQFGGSDPADIIHDFQRGLTAYHDITLDKCYVIELNTTIVMPPRNLWELLVNVKKGTYLPQTYIIQEEMIATEHVHDMEQLGSFIYRLCSGKETYRLKRRSARRRISRREAENCHRIRHFENTFVVETVICKKS